MKKKKSLFILLGILAVLLIVYFGLQAWNRSEAEKEEQENEGAVIHVAETDPEDIVSISLDVGNGEMEFVKEDHTWYYTADRDFPLAES